MDKVCQEARTGKPGERTDKDRSGEDPTSKLPAEKWACEGNGEGVLQEGGEMNSSILKMKEEMVRMFQCRGEVTEAEG